jgi:signal transduction histidine kinase
MKKQKVQFSIFILWAISALIVFILPMLQPTPLLTIRAVNEQAFLWFVIAIVATLFACGAIGWQRKEFPWAWVMAISILLAVWWLIPSMWEGVRKPLIILHADSWQYLFWFIGLITVMIIAMLWVGWRLRITMEVLKRRARLANIVQSQTSEGIVLLDKQRKLLWSNGQAQRYFKHMPTEVTRLTDRALESKRIQSQNFAVGEGERINVQIVPQSDGTAFILMKSVQNYADATQFYEHFIRRLVHDMRNPLAAIIAHASNLHTAQLPEPQSYQKTAQTIENEAQRLTRLVDSMLFDARLSYVPLALQQIDLRDVVEDVFYQHDENAIRQGKQVTLELPPKPCMLDADRDLMTRAMSNLVDNSLKYSSTGCVVELTLEIESDHYLLKIKDSGDGIPEDMLPDKIFDALVRGQKGQGSGLGLAIVKKIVEMHNGTIKVQSVMGEGTTMVIWLPK